MSTLAARQYNFVDDKNSSVPITASRMDSEFNNQITKLNQKVLIAATAPSTPIAGMLWYDSTNKLLKEYRNSEWCGHGITHVGTAAPSTAQEGDLWYDTANNLLKSYDGSNWITSADMSFPASTAQGDLLYLSAASTNARLAKDTNSKRVLTNTGTNNNPAWAQVDKDGASGLFGAWETLSNNTVYQAATDLIVCAYNESGGQILGYTDASNPPTTVRVIDTSTASNAAITFPVRKGDYWKTGGAGYVYALAVGS